MNANDFKNIDVPGKIKKPRVAYFVIRKMLDTNPDLSHLTDHLCGAEYAEQDNERLAAYERGAWCMVGIRAECVYLLDAGTIPTSAIMQTLTSGGLWGIESDSGEEYFKEVANEEINSLKRYCDQLGITYDDKTPMERREE